MFPWIKGEACGSYPLLFAVLWPSAFLIHCKKPGIAHNLTFILNSPVDKCSTKHLPRERFC